MMRRLTRYLAWCVCVCLCVCVWVGGWYTESTFERVRLWGMGDI